MLLARATLTWGVAYWAATLPYLHDIRVYVGVFKMHFLFQASSAGTPPFWIQILPWIGIFVVFYFLLIRPQMRQQKEHREKIAGIKRGDTVITAGGIIGKVTKVDDAHAEIEIAKGIKVSVVKSTIGDIVSPKVAAAND